MACLEAEPTNRPESLDAFLGRIAKVAI
jgi:hypothetical protein